MTPVPQSFKDKYRNPYFDHKLVMLDAPRYVCWIDLMGSSALMRRSHVMAAIAIGHFHSILLQAKQLSNFNGKMYPLVDGAYITTVNRHQMQTFIKAIFKLSAINFILTEDEHNLRMIRGSIAFGQVIEGENLKDASRLLQDNFENHMTNVLLGAPLAIAHEAESRASPFGVWVDESARQFCPPNGKTLRWTAWPWWGYEARIPDLDKDCNDIERMLAEKISAYFNWCGDNYISMIYDVNRMRDHVERARQYFDSWPSN